jgi:hypothetical protein
VSRRDRYGLARRSPASRSNRQLDTPTHVEPSPDRDTAPRPSTTTIHGVRPTEASYDLQPGKQPPHRARRCPQRSAQRGRSVAAVPERGPGVAVVERSRPSGPARSLLHGPFALARGRRLGERGMAGVACSCATGLDFRYHIAVIDPAAAARLAAPPGGGANGIYEAEIVGNRRLRSSATSASRSTTSRTARACPRCRPPVGPSLMTTSWEPRGSTWQTRGSLWAPSRGQTRHSHSRRAMATIAPHRCYQA